MKSNLNPLPLWLWVIQKEPQKSPCWVGSLTSEIRVRIWGAKSFLMRQFKLELNHIHFLQKENDALVLKNAELEKRVKELEEINKSYNRLSRLKNKKP